MIVGVAVTIPGRPLAGGGAAPPATPINIIQSVPVLQWCRSDLGITLATGVSGWADQSGNGNHYSQATGANQPTYNAADATLNNRPTLTSGNVGNKRLSSAIVLSPPFFIICVWRSNTSAINVVHSGKPASGNGALLFIADAGANLYQNNGGSVHAQAALPTGTFCRSFENYSNSAGDYISVAGRVKLTGQNAGSASSINGFDLGGQPAFAGDITFAEIIICAGEPTAPELAALDAYLVSLYGLGVVYGTPKSIFGNSVALSTLQWCRADLGVTIATGVSVWADQSGNGKDYTQATAALQPTRNAADATLNNLPTIAFDGVDDSLGSALVLPQASVTPTCLLMVSKDPTAVGGNKVILSPGALVTNCIFRPVGGGNLASNNSGQIEVAAPPNTWGRLRADWSNSAGDVVKFGPTSNTGNAGNNAASGNGRTISGFAGAPAAVTIFEIVYLNRIPTISEVLQFDKYVTATTAGTAAV